MRRIVIWSVGILLCLLFVVYFWPVERSGDRWWSMPVTGRLVFIFSSVCLIILVLTHLVDRLFKKRIDEVRKLP
jgi:hypothetical protein